MKALKGIGKFLLRAVIVAAGIFALGWLLWFIFELITRIATIAGNLLEGAWNTTVSDWWTYVVFVLLAAIVWSGVDFIRKVRSTKK